MTGFHESQLEAIVRLETVKSENHATLISL